VNVEIDDPAPSHREVATASTVADVHRKTCNCLLGKVIEKWPRGNIQLLVDTAASINAISFVPLWKSNIRRPMILVGPSLGGAVAIDFGSIFWMLSFLTVIPIRIENLKLQGSKTVRIVVSWFPQDEAL
ncbi:unnamed protein product, partial [Ilex paraguariensis]